jgi:hypothetical protein
MIQHIKIKNCKYKSHTEAAKKIRESSHNTITLEDGQTLQKHSFSETFPHLVDCFTLPPRASHRLSWRRKSFVSMFVDYRTSQLQSQ